MWASRRSTSSRQRSDRSPSTCRAPGRTHRASSCRCRSRLMKRLSSLELEVEHAMNEQITRDELLRRALAGGAFLSLPGLLAACGGGGSKSAATTTTSGSQTMPKSLTFSNWPLYIDINEKTKTHPSLVAFQKHYGVHVKYLEDIN